MGSGIYYDSTILWPGNTYYTTQASSSPNPCPSPCPVFCSGCFCLSAIHAALLSADLPLHKRCLLPSTPLMRLLPQRSRIFEWGGFNLHVIGDSSAILDQRAWPPSRIPDPVRLCESFFALRIRLGSPHMQLLDMKGTYRTGAISWMRRQPICRRQNVPCIPSARPLGKE